MNATSRFILTEMEILLKKYQNLTKNVLSL